MSDRGSIPSQGSNVKSLCPRPLWHLARLVSPGLHETVYEDGVGQPVSFVAMPRHIMDIMAMGIMDLISSGDAASLQPLDASTAFDAGTPRLLGSGSRFLGLPPETWPLPVLPVCNPKHPALLAMIGPGPDHLVGRMTLFPPSL